MTKYYTYKVKLLTTGVTYEIMAKDGIDAREQAADMFDIEFDQTQLI